MQTIGMKKLSEVEYDGQIIGDPIRSSFTLLEVTKGGLLRSLRDRPTAALIRPSCMLRDTFRLTYRAHA